MKANRAIVVSPVIGSLLAMLAGPVAAQWITFASTPEQSQAGSPSPLSSPVRAFLSVPVEPGRYPAVVMLTSCEGRRAYHQTWAQALSERGFVALVVDDYFMHDRPRTCDIDDPAQRGDLLRMRLRHARGAARYLAARADVDGRRMAVMGWGDAPLGALMGAHGEDAAQGERFRAGVVMTPPSCASLSGASSPVLVLRAASEPMDGTCDSQPLELRVYDGTVPGFDDPQAESYERLAHTRAIDDVAAFLVRALPPSGGKPERELTAVPTTMTEQGTWAIDPNMPGPDLPPAGGSAFDAVFSRATPNGITHDVPYPFSRLLDVLAQAAGGETMPRSPLDATLIPLGRSLQRESAAPDYFRSPRIVVAVTGEPASGTGPLGLQLANRLFLGYQPRANVIEVISYNEVASRFEFQIVRDYAAGREPRVGYARRALCTSCHQNAAPIFSDASWDETTANAAVVRQLAGLGATFHGVAVSEDDRAVTAIDIATDEANLLPVYQRLWAEGCASSRMDETARCRAGLLQAMIQYRLSGSAGFDRSAPLYADGYLWLQRRNWSARWPDGLLIPNPNLPNRAPLISPTPSVVPPALDPLRERAPLARWHVSSARDLDGFVRGVSHALPARHMTLLDRHLRESGERERARTLTASCRMLRRGLGGRSRQIEIECGDRPVTEDAFYLQALLRLTPDGIVAGEAGWLEAGGGSYARRALSGRIEDAQGANRIALRILRGDERTPIRASDGNSIAGLEIVWADDIAQSTARLDATGTLAITDDFRPVVETLASLAAAAAPSSPLLSERLDGIGLADWLLAELGVLPGGDRLATRPTPAPRLDAEAGPSDSALSAALEHRGPLLTFQRYCGACHGGDTDFPPGFLHGAEAELPGALAQCAERIYYRLYMWHRPRDDQRVPPMPPAQGLSLAHTTPEEWRRSESLERLLAYARDRLIEDGRDPAAVLDGGYPATRACLAGRDE